MLAYYWFDVQRNVQTMPDTVRTLTTKTMETVPLELAKQQQIQFGEIERLKESFKTHRCTLDFDSGFINTAMRDSKQ